MNSDRVTHRPAHTGFNEPVRGPVDNPQPADLPLKPVENLSQQPEPPLSQREQGAPDPDEGETLGRAQGIAIDGPDIVRSGWMAHIGAIPDQVGRTNLT